VHTIAVATLEKSVSKILSSLPFKQILNTRAISIVNFTTPKQTETTQRWKIKLKVASNTLEVNTKIEFSRRKAEMASVLEPIAKSLSINYNLRTIYVSHYPTDIALQQKILALILRTETQARDIFDINLLLQQGASIAPNQFTAAELDTAIANANSISFAEFKAQVVSYLEYEYIKQYSDASIWQSIIDSVITYLGELNAINKRL